MRPKVLFFIDFWLTHFALANELQQKCKPYALIDLNDKPKKFLKTQKIVNFEKEWYLRDEVTKFSEPDIEFLEHVENKFKINLWKIASSERMFLDYNYYHTFARKEILSILEQECRLFEKIIDEINPDYLCIRISDWHHMYLLTEMCKAKDIRVLTLADTKFAGKNMITQNPDQTDELIKLPEKVTKRTSKQIEDFFFNHSKNEFIKKYNSKFHNSKKHKIKAAMEFFLTSGNKEYTNFYINFGKTKSKVLIEESTKRLKWKSRGNFLNKYAIQKINDEKIIYFPLHAEPERALLIASPYLTNQIEVIKNVAKSLPVNYWLYVKEHPAMNSAGWRDTEFYKKILHIPNVRLVHPSVSSQEIIKKSSLVIGVKGTGALEAVFYKKPAIIFSDFWGDQFFTTIIKLNNFNDLHQTILQLLEKDVDDKELNMYIQIFEDNSFEFDNSMLLLDIWEIFYFGGMLVNVEIPEEKIDMFLKKYEDEFKTLGHQHLQKINQISENTL